MHVELISCMSGEGPGFRQSPCWRHCFPCVWRRSRTLKFQASQAKMLLPLLLAALWGSSGSQAMPEEYWMDVPKVVTVPAGLCVLVPCSVWYPRPGQWEYSRTFGYWYQWGTRGGNKQYGPPVATNNPDEKVHWRTQGRFQLVGNPQNQNCSLLIRDAQVGDNNMYFFRVERGESVKYSFLKYMLKLEVTALTPKPTIYVPETLEPGRQVTVLCVFNWTFEGCPIPAFSWRGAALSNPGVTRNHPYFSTVTFTPGLQHHNSTLTCQVDASSKGVSAERTVQLRVAYAPQELTISISRGNTSAPDLHRQSTQTLSLDVQEGQSLQLLCAAEAEPPAILSWALGDRVLAWSPPSFPGALALALPQMEAGDGGRYTCRAENRLGVGSLWLDLSVHYAPRDLTVTVSQENRTVLDNLGDSSTLSVLEGQSLRLLCVSHSNPPARLSWSLGGQTLSTPQPTDPGVLELLQIQREQQGELSCLAQNALGSQHVSLNLLVQYPPWLLGPSCSWEDEGLCCNCTSMARPAPSLRWRLGEQLLEGNSINDSIQVSFSYGGSWANSSLSLRGELSSDLSLSCEAQNPHGTRSAALLPLPEEKGLISKTFSHGILLGIAVMTLLLCFILIIMKTVRRKGPGVERVTRRSTILDYINVVPRAGPLARNRKPKESSPSQASPASAVSPESKGNQKEFHYVPHSHPGPRSPTQVPEPKSKQEELHYATLNFPGVRPREPPVTPREMRTPRETRAPQSSCSDYEYAEVRFH